MKKLFIALFLVSLFAVGCVTTKANVSCPPKDVVFFAETPFGLYPFTMPEGFFCPETEGNQWMDAEEYNELSEPEPEEKGFEHQYEGQTTLILEW